ncbi:AraC family transcriptional regulator [Eubacterium multiforme]|uniref:AraC family transcriptional regulator of arabinose operon n=1 Tax=Eubacterium multiforme TaxID=83339 RepID=A0ABT9UV74_9FIRM|nr:AraC family transcriptional regulator [Eubacterium multiforme]MDQ0150225.1 AraC family transcriptional regulator of arabinose operon [Eubacterium multiforme]
MDNFFGIFKTNNILSKELFIYECGYENCEANKPFEYAPIDYYLIHYIVEGEGTAIINGVKYVLKKGDGFLIPPKATNKYFPCKKNPWKYKWIGFNGTECKRLLNLCGFSKDNYSFRYTKDNCINNYFDNIFDCSNNGDLFSSIGYLYLFLGTLIREHDNNKSDYNVSNENTYVTKALDFIHKNYTEDISISDIASEININRSHLFKLFKLNMTISPQQYLINYRLNKACNLLKENISSINEIAYLTGFNSPSYFSRIFTKYKGISPASYRSNSLNK